MRRNEDPVQSTTTTKKKKKRKKREKIEQKKKNIYIYIKSISQVSVPIFNGRIIFARFFNHHICKQDSLNRACFGEHKDLPVGKKSENEYQTSTCSNLALWGFIIPGLASIPFWFHRPRLDALSGQCSQMAEPLVGG